MEFLIQRGNHKLVPLGGLQEFPDAILNAKRLDLYNLYREVRSFAECFFIKISCHDFSNKPFNFWKCFRWSQEVGILLEMV